MSICNTNDFVIPIWADRIGLNFLDAEYAPSYYHRIRLHWQPTEQWGRFWTPSVSEFAYLSGQIVHLKGDARHGVNATQLSYIKDFSPIACYFNKAEPHRLYALVPTLRRKTYTSKACQRKTLRTN